MENIAIVILVGLSLFGNGYCADVNADASAQTSGAPGAYDCVVKAVQTSPSLLAGLAGLACMDTPGEEDPQATDKFVEKINSFLAAAKCEGLKITGINLDGTTSQVAPTLRDTVKELKSILDQVGLTEAAVNLICKLTNGLVQSQCLDSLVKEKITGLLTKLSSAQKLACAVKDKNGINVENIKQILTNAACSVGDALNTDVLKGTSKVGQDLINDALIKFIHVLLSDTKLSKTVDGALCDGTQAVDTLLKGKNVWL